MSSEGRKQVAFPYVLIFSSDTYIHSYIYIYIYIYMLKRSKNTILKTMKLMETRYKLEFL